MAKKKEPDKLARDAAAALAAKMSYGKWKALQGNPVPQKKADGIPDGWKVCKRCGKHFKPTNKNQKYCEYKCQREEAEEKHKTKHLETMKRYRERKKTERAENES